MRDSSHFPAFACSANLCEAAFSLSTLPFLQNFGNINGLSCCGYSLCNTVKKVVYRDTQNTGSSTTVPTGTSTTAPTGTSLQATGSSTTAPTGTSSKTNDACCSPKGMSHLLLALLIFTLY